jgi:hypothetical protein
MIKKFLKLDFDFDFVLIAITTPLKDYRLCYKVNLIAQTDFRKLDDLQLNFKQNTSKYHSFYLHQTPNSDCQFYLIANKGSDGLLIPEMKEVDFFVIIREYIDEDDLLYFLNKLKTIKDIQAAVEINPERLKSRENLLF